MRSSRDNIAAALAERRLPVRTIYIASYLPRKCGIATFTKDLTTAINNVNPEAPAEIIAINDPGQDYDYPWEVKVRINQHKKSDYDLAARYINQSSADIVCLQHEFGLYGGPEGDFSAHGPHKLHRGQPEDEHYYLLDLLERLDKPIVSTFHTILPEPDAYKRYIMGRVIELSEACVAMTEHGRQLLINIYGCPPEKAIVIYHGVPDFTFNQIALHKKRLRIKAEPMILAAGLIGPGKGLEQIISAMPAILKVLPKTKFYVVGQTHPVILRNEGEAYRESLIALANRLHVGRSIRFVNKYLETEDLRHYFQAADFFITAYKGLEHSGSGMLAWALGAGKVCISTPYNYANEVLDRSNGLIVKPGSSEDIAETVMSVYGDPKHMHDLRERAYAMGRKFTWPNVGLNYFNLFKLVTSHAARAEQTKAPQPVATRT